MAVSRYRKKISDPLLDHIDIHVEVPRVDYENLADKHNVEHSKTIRARAYHRVLKLARTIADLAGSEMIAANHIAEAIQYMPKGGDVDYLIHELSHLYGG